ncbi:hypothetical protein ACETRX_24345 [Labrys portucalensis]|uniref:DUF2927 domain-containing protein n=1 Tax=Labrys neptuniae TaxID=376174 RepID=A0ABV3PK30_9HYPH|nr:hypothetical protein [Labrys neptuniae]MDT3379889.1 hypothetical protein [Labrys neptuniae]
MSLPRPWREILPQLLSTALIPLTVAGIGWYYTRWQQNLADLRTMIDLMTDAAPEKRKYGVAMFEYLLKNDKVPVEFITAQLDYANSSSDRDLLPLLESAVQKASLVNNSVKSAYEEATARLPSRVFVHALNDSQRPCAGILLDEMKDGDKSAITFPSVVLAKWSGETHELRYFKASDRKRAEALAELFATVGLQLTAKDLSTSWSGARDSRPNTFEIWFGNPALPPNCLQPQK